MLGRRWPTSRKFYNRNEIRPPVANLFRCGGEGGRSNKCNPSALSSSYDVFAFRLTLAPPSAIHRGEKSWRAAPHAGSLFHVGVYTYCATGKVPERIWMILVSREERSSGSVIQSATDDKRQEFEGRNRCSARSPRKFRGYCTSHCEIGGFEFLSDSAC